MDEQCVCIRRSNLTHLETTYGCCVFIGFQVYFRIDSIVNYVYELSQHQGISPTNDDYTGFCLSDVDSKEEKLKVLPCLK